MVATEVCQWGLKLVKQDNINILLFMEAIVNFWII